MMIACMATVNDNGYSQIVDGNVRQNPFSGKTSGILVYSDIQHTTTNSIYLSDCNLSVQQRARLICRARDQLDVPTIDY